MTTPSREFTELRVALVLNGGVSLAVWIGGVCDEFLRFMTAGQRLRDPDLRHRLAAGMTDEELAATLEHDWLAPYVRACYETRVYPVVDVMVGTSAGGLNSVLLGAAIARGRPDLSVLREVWVKLGQMETMLREPGSPDMPSLLRGDYFLDELKREIGTVLADDYLDPIAGHRPELIVRLTATSLGGTTSQVGSDDNPIWDTSHRVQFHFDEQDFGHGKRPEDRFATAGRLATAARCTASFPGAFEPVTVDVGDFNDEGAQRLIGVGTARTVHLIDGGVLANLPAEEAIDAIVEQRADGPVRRFLTLVVPDPADAPELRDGDEPDVLDVIKAATLTIPRSQSLQVFVDDLRNHNLAAASERAGREWTLSVITNPDQAEVFLDQATSVLQAYRQRRYAIIGESLRQARLTTPPIDELLFIPVGFEPEPGRCWGSRTPRHLATILVRLAGALHRQQPQSDYGTWIAAITADLPDQAEGSLKALLEDGGPPDFWPLGADATGADAAAKRAALDGHIDHLASVAAAIADRVSENPDAYSAALRGFALLMSTERGPRYGLLALEVLGGSFGGFEMVPDQIIDPINITSRNEVDVDTADRHRAHQKLTGSRLGHFGAFLLPSWRANDWMWGRLDGSQRIVDLLAMSSRDDAAYGSVTTEAPTIPNGRLGELRHSIQKGVLAQELPYLAELVGDEEGASRRRRAKEASRSKRLADARIGEETPASLVGTQAFTEALTKAANNVTTMLSQRGPSLVRITAATAGGVTSLAWRVHKISRRRDPAVAAVLGAVFAVSAIVVFSGLEALWSDSWESWAPGLVETAAWSFFLAITFWGAVVAPGPTMVLTTMAVSLAALRFRNVACSIRPGDTWWCAWDELNMLGARRFGFAIAVYLIIALVMWFLRPVARISRAGLAWLGRGTAGVVVAGVALAYVPATAAFVVAAAALLVAALVGWMGTRRRSRPMAAVVD